MKNPFVSDEFLQTKVTITPEQLGDAIQRAVHKELRDMPDDMPAKVKEKMAQLYLMFGATVMTELLYVDLHLDPENFKTEKEEVKDDADKTY